MKRRTFTVPLVIALSLAFFGLLAQGAVPDVPTGQWLPGPALAQPRAGTVSVALDDGRVLVIGGRTADGPVDTVEVLNADGSIGVGAPMLARRAGHAAAKLLDGRVFVVGGTTIVTSDTENGPVTSEAVTNSAEIFDVFANVWYPAVALTVGRSGHTATAIADGRVLVAGGTGQDGAALDSFEVFDAETGQFASAGLLSAPRAEHAAAAGATSVVVAGGRNGTGVLGTADLIDIESGTVSSVVLNSPRAGASATTLLDGKILVAGGSNGATDLASAEVIDPVTGISMSTGSMTEARSSHQALLLNHNNTVLVTGGTSSGAVAASAEQFVPWTGEFSPTGAPATARGAAVMSNLSKDGVAWLAAGRAADSTLVAASEFFGFATLKTDKDDYPPGSTVVISGSGWQPGERVTMVLHEVGTGHADRTYHAVADTTGRITNNQFATDLSHIGVRFYVNARGAASHAQVTFTDALQTDVTLTSSTNPSVQGQAVTFTATVTYAQAGQPGSGINVGDPVTIGTVRFGEGNNCGGNFTQLQTPQTPGLNGQVTFTTSSLGVGDHTIRACYNGTGGGSGTQSNFAQLSQAVNSCTAPSVTTQPAHQSITYGSNAAFTVAAGGSPAPTVQWQVSTNGGGAWTNLGGETATTLSLTRPTVSMSGNQYRVVFTNTCTPSTATSDAASLTVSPKNLTITGAAAQSKVYDGTTAATVSFSGASLVGVESGDAVTINSAGYTANFNNKNVGTAKPVTVTGVTLNGAAAGNYTVSQPSGLEAHITAVHLTATITADPKVYDGTTAATIHIALGPGVVGNETVTVSGTGTFDTPAAGLGKTVTANDIALGGLDAGNYTVNSTATTTANIQARRLTTTVVASDKTYDGTTTATPTGCTLGAGGAGGVVSGDVVSCDFGSATATFASKDIGSHTVNVSGLGLVGAAAGNYQITGTASTTAAINAKALTATITADPKVYDGTTAATIHITLGPGVVGNETVTVSGTGTFDTPAAGLGKTVTANDIALGGSDAGNYTVNSTATTTANIQARRLTTTVVASDKTYDGTTTATLTGCTLGAGGAGGVVSADVVSCDTTDATAFFSDKNVGVGKTVTATGLDLNGGAAGNYAVNGSATTTADITRKTLTVSASGVDKVYDGNTAATVTLSDDRVSGDVFTASYATAAFSDKHVGNGKAVDVSGISIAGTDAGNYALANTTASTTASISARTLTVTALASNKVYDGTTTASVTLADDRVTNDVLVITFASAAFSDKNVANGKTVTVNGISVAGADAGNYAANTSTTATANITPAPLTIAAVDKAITFSAPSPTFGVTYAGFVPGETSSALAGTMTYTFQGVSPTSYGPSTTVPTAVGTYTNTPGGVSNANYAITFTPGSYTIAAWTLTGFYQPVTMGGIYNTVKGGSTVPLKFNIYQGAQGVDERTDTGAITGFAVTQSTCAAAPEDPVDFVTTGGTNLRYDATAHQFIQNWQTPKVAGNCYRVTMTALDGSTLVAYFKTK